MIKQKLSPIYFILFFLVLLAPATLQAKVYIDLEAPSIRQLPIAVQDFLYTGSPARNPEEERLISSIRTELVDALTSDIEFTRLFKVIPKEAFIEDPAEDRFAGKEINFREWRMIGADTLVKGRFQIQGDRLTLDVRLFDCLRERLILGKRYIGSISNPRKLSHYFADKLYEELTGRKGIFTTKMLFISNATGNKEVYASDYDGKNVVRLTRNGSINLSPQWSPDGKKMLYTSYKNGWANIYMLDLRTGRDTVVSKKEGINIGGRFSPDGKRVALTLSEEKSPELYILDLDSRDLTRLTDNYGIDVSPTWSPDGKKMAYVSDISGNPHIFVLDFPTGKTRRLTYKGKYNSSPAWSPDGDKITFARSNTGAFNIWVASTNSDKEAQLTFEGNNISPSWSPDGRYIVFSSTVRGVSSIYIMQADGTGLLKVTTGVGNETTPVWSPFLY